MDERNSKLIYSDLLNFLHKKIPCVLATITGTQGSTPREKGSSAVFGNERILAGSIGGGITELMIEKIASEKIKSKKSGYYHFDLNNEITELDNAICGGSLNVLVDAEPENNHSVFETLNYSFLNHIPGILITVCINKTPDLSDLTRHWLTEKNKQIISGKIDPIVFEAAVEMLEKGSSSNYKEFKFTKGNREKIAFLELVQPLPQLIIAGAGHVGKALSHLGKLLDFEVTIWDDRPEFANAESLPDADKILNGAIDQSLAKFYSKKDSYIVIVTRGHKNDADVLRQLIKSEAGYIGMIGSRKKIAQVRESSIKNGWATEEEWKRIHSPIGLEISSKTVQEIAISIATQLIQVRNQFRKS